MKRPIKVRVVRKTTSEAAKGPLGPVAPERDLNRPRPDYVPPGLWKELEAARKAPASQRIPAPMYIPEGIRTKLVADGLIPPDGIPAYSPQGPQVDEPKPIKEYTIELIDRVISKLVVMSNVAKENGDYIACGEDYMTIMEIHFDIDCLRSLKEWTMRDEGDRCELSKEDLYDDDYDDE